MDGFDQFKALYPRREAWKDARKAWGQVDGDRHLEAILAALAWQVPEMLQREKVFRPLPASWLRGERWTDQQSPPVDHRTPEQRASDEKHTRAVAQQIEWARRRQTA